MMILFHPFINSIPVNKLHRSPKNQIDGTNLDNRNRKGINQKKLFHHGVFLLILLNCEFFKDVAFSLYRICCKILFSISSSAFTLPVFCVLPKLARVTMRNLGFFRKKLHSFPILSTKVATTELFPEP